MRIIKMLFCDGVTLARPPLYAARFELAAAGLNLFQLRLLTCQPLFWFVPALEVVPLVSKTPTSHSLTPSTSTLFGGDLLLGNQTVRHFLGPSIHSSET